MKGQNVTFSFRGFEGKERTVTLEPLSGGFFEVYAKDVELGKDGGSGYEPGFPHDGRHYCFHSIGTNGRIRYQDVTTDGF
jgi:hypothetical protein